MAGLLVHVLQIGDAVAGVGGSVDAVVPVVTARVPSPDAGVVEGVAVPSVYLFTLICRSAGITGDLVAIELDEGPHDVFSVVEQGGV